MLGFVPHLDLPRHEATITGSPDNNLINPEKDQNEERDAINYEGKHSLLSLIKKWREVLPSRH